MLEKPQRQTVTVAFGVPVVEHRLLIARATSVGVTLAELVRNAMRESLWPEGVDPPAWEADIRQQVEAEQAVADQNASALYADYQRKLAQVREWEREAAEEANEPAKHAPKDRAGRPASRWLA